MTLYERRAWGGKARSTTIPHSGANGRAPLPGEHGFRFEFGFYQNLPDTMRRIPFGGNRNGVFDNMVPAPQVNMARAGKRNLVLPLGALDPRPYTPTQVIDVLAGLLVEMQLPPDAVAYFAHRMAVFFSSCPARRFGQWEKVTWSDFIGTDRFSDDYGKILGGLVQFVQASKPAETATTFPAFALEQLLANLTGRGANGAPFRILDGPTNDRWFDPWLTELRRLGVQLRSGELLSFRMHDDQIAGADIRTSGGRRTVEADWYVCALPGERAAQLMSPEVVAADPSLGSLSRLRTGWMNGVQLFLSSAPDLAEGLTFCVDAPWAISILPQARFWKGDFADQYGDGATHEKLSTIIADWTVPGTRVKKRADECAPGELVEELWFQVKRHVNGRGSAVLRDEMLLSWDIDPGMLVVDNRLISEDPLALPTVATAQYRPAPATGIRNLFLAGDYLDGDWDVGHMEAANYNGRRAANAVLERSDSHASPSQVRGPYRPPEWRALQRVDELRYHAGQPNLIETQGVAALAGW